MLLSNQSRSMSIFWAALIRKMQQNAMDVSVCVPPGDTASEHTLASYGCRIVNYDLDRKGLNPLSDLASFSALKTIFKREKPDLLFATTIKPVIYGCAAAAAAGIPHIYATITGLGYAFEADTPFKKIINRITRFLYRRALSKANGVFFQNQDDAELFVRQGILHEQDSRVLFAPGTGVNTMRFAPTPLPPTPPVFLLVGRLLEAKGIAEYAAAATILKTEYPEARFQILGPRESGPGSLDPAVLNTPAIEYLGEAADVRPHLNAAHVVVLPSWREGLPTALMEAMSCGRPLVATNVPGCRDLVVDGVNGFLTSPKDAPSLARGMEHFLRQPDLIAKMGRKGRELAVKKYDADMVATNILSAMTG